MSAANAAPAALAPAAAGAEQCPTCGGRTAHGGSAQLLKACSRWDAAARSAVDHAASLDWQPPAEVATSDLFAHVRTRIVDGYIDGLDDAALTSAITRVVADLGWRPPASRGSK